MVSIYDRPNLGPSLFFTIVPIILQTKFELAVRGLTVSGTSLVNGVSTWGVTGTKRSEWEVER